MRHDDRGDDVSVAPSTTTASSRLFVTRERAGGRETRRSEIDLRVIGNPSAVNLGEISVDEFPARFVAFPARRAGGKKNFCVDDVYSPFGTNLIKHSSNRMGFMPVHLKRVKRKKNTYISVKIKCTEIQDGRIG